MTATPDKRDDSLEGRNVYDLLCPFHYFGISDLSVVDEEELSRKKFSDEKFRNLTSDDGKNKG